MRDGFLRRAVKRVALLGFRANLAAHRAWRRARGDRPWTLTGGCRRSGGCCEAPAIAANRLWWTVRLARRLFLAWQHRVNGFELVPAETRDRVFVFRCSHFDPATRSCDSYDSRPGPCRDYPRVLLWQASPELLPGCGFRARPPNAEGLEAALERAELTEDQREKLRRGLRLDG